MIDITVIICTHNPVKEFLDRAINCLKSQSLPVDQWELLIVDNKSNVPVEKMVDLKWHPHGRYVYEPNLGLTQARIRGIREAKGSYLVFVDDDNCLDTRYLEVASIAMKANPLLGVLGAGRILPEFEVEPLPEAKSFLIMLALRNESRSYYSSEVSWGKAIPFGAGMTIKKCLALDYVEALRGREQAQGLGRSGNSLLSGEDVDIALHACSRQHIVGVIPELILTHIIPQKRVTKEYLVKIAAGHAYSHFMLGKMWGYLADYPENTLLKKLRYIKKWISNHGLARAIMKAEYVAVEEARAAWNEATTSKVR